MRTRLLLVLISWVGIWATACTESTTTDGASTDGASVFSHDFAGTTVPWTHDDFDVRDDRLTIALFSDLTGGERPRIFEITVAQMAMLRPGSRSGETSTCRKASGSSSPEVMISS